MNAMKPMIPLRLEPLTVERLPLFHEFLGDPGFGGCYCAVWTSMGADWSRRCADDARPNFDITASFVAAGRHAGFFAVEGNEVVAWTGSGPKTSFPLLATKLGSRLSAFRPEVWAVGCIAVPESHRGRGIAGRVVAAVVDMAARAGAHVVEGYPTRPFDEPRSYRGTVWLYERLGFHEAASERDGPVEILLMRRRVT